MTRPKKRARKHNRPQAPRDLLTKFLDMLLLIHQKETGLKTRVDLYKFKLGLIISNIIANILGLAAMIVIVSVAGFKPWNLGFKLFSVGWMSVLGAVPFAVGFLLTAWYERPIWQCTDALFHKTSIPEKIWTKARRRALNEPYFIVVMNTGLWLGAGAFISALQWLSGAPANYVQIPFFAGLSTGLIVSSYAFFLAEHVIQFHIVPYIFPQGDLAREARAIRTRIPTRLMILMLAVNLVPFLSQILLINMLVQLQPYLPDPINTFQTTLKASAAAFILLGFIVAFQLGMNMSIPFMDILKVLKAIREGRYDQRAAVSSNDEIGYTAEAVNEMARGLEERRRMSRSIDLAREVQQNLMPSRPPRVQGLDMAGRSIFCNRTGGDYFDYVELADPGQEGRGRLAVVVGDVSDHGLHAAMLMISARAYLRHHLCHSEDLSEIAFDVNHHLVEDIKDSGQFMTGVLVLLDPREKKINWVRAGHDPGILYDPVEDRFEELDGEGVAFGLQDDIIYPEYSRSLKCGQIILLATDGAWEARSPGGPPFGKERLTAVVRDKARSSAEEILSEILKTLECFTETTRFQDDVSLVVIKVLD